MAKKRQSGKGQPDRGWRSRPLDALVFLLPLIVFYEVVCLFHGQTRVIAFDLLQRFFELFGHFGIWAPGFGVVAILLATHAVSGESWTIHWATVGRMYVEACALAIPLLTLNWFAPLAAGEVDVSGLLDQIAMGVGAGIFEELVFRLALIAIIVMIGADLLRFDRTGVAVAAIILSSLVFAAHHHPPIGVEPFTPRAFAFRTVAGAYLATVFWFRGYGPAAGCHAAYNVVLTIFQTGN